MDQIAVQQDGTGGSPTRSAQEVLRRMSINSPPSRTDNPRQVKRAKLLAGDRGAKSADPPNAPRRGGGYFTAQTPLKHPQRSPRAALDAPSPVPSWGGRSSRGMSLRDASYGESLEVSDPSSFYPSCFDFEALRQPYDGTESPLASSSRTVDDSSSMDGDDTFALPCSPTSQEGPRGALQAAMDRATVPGTPVRRPGSVARSRLGERGSDAERDGEKARRGDGGSCSPVRAYNGAEASGSGPHGSPVKKRGVGRWRLPGGGGSGGFSRDGSMPSPPRSNRNPFSPNVSGGADAKQEDTLAMPAPAPRTSARLAAGDEALGRGDMSPMDAMDTGEVVDFAAIASGLASGKSDDGSFLRRVSAGSCVSVADCGGSLRKNPEDVTEPSPCDVTAFVPITPYRDGLPGLGGDGGATPMSPAPDVGNVYLSSGKGARTNLNAGRSGILGGQRERGLSSRSSSSGGATNRRGRFASDFEELEIIGSGSFGTVHKVRSRVDGCLYAVKCTRRRFRGEADRQNMLREVYALAAVCDAQETINIVRYHQAWIEDERLYIQTELCETSLEKQLEKGQQLDIPGVYAFLRQTLLGLEILHRHKLVHLDIKPGNIFVKNGQYKLGDFGLVTPVHVRSSTDVAEGDCRYMSKELLNDDHSNLTKCDVFSLGITLYEIISGRPLPPNGDEWHRLRSGRVNMPMGLPADLSQTLGEMMQSEPSRRPSAAELLRYPCLQSEMERQLNDHRSKLNRERTHNQALKEEVTALIQKQSQRSGRLSRTITWDNSFFSKSDSNLLMKRFDGTTPSRDNLDRGGPSLRFNPGVFGPGSSVSKFGVGRVAGQGLASVAEDVETKEASTLPGAGVGDGSASSSLDLWHPYG